LPKLPRNTDSNPSKRTLKEKNATYSDESYNQLFHGKEMYDPVRFYTLFEIQIFIILHSHFYRHFRIKLINFRSIISYLKKGLSSFLLKMPNILQALKYKLLFES